MFNNPLIHEEARRKISEREQEAKAHQRYSQLGYSDHGTARWVFALMILIVALILTMALL